MVIYDYCFAHFEAFLCFLTWLITRKSWFKLFLFSWNELTFIIEYRASSKCLTLSFNEVLRFTLRLDGCCRPPFSLLLLVHLGYDSVLALSNRMATKCMSCFICKLVLNSYKFGSRTPETSLHHDPKTFVQTWRKRCFNVNPEVCKYVASCIHWFLPAIMCKYLTQCSPHRLSIMYESLVSEISCLYTAYLIFLHA